MKKSRRKLLSLNKTRIHNLNYVSRIYGGGTTNCQPSDECPTAEDCPPSIDCKSSAYAPPTGGDGLIAFPTPTLTNGLPGNDCC